MTWLFTLLAMAVVAVVAGLATGRISGGMEAPASSLPFRGLPPEAVRPADLDTLRFSPALRGYRMDEVDLVIDRLGDELRRRDEEIARLGAELPDPRLEPPGAGGQTPGTGISGDTTIDGVTSPSTEAVTSAEADTSAEASPSAAASPEAVPAAGSGSGQAVDQQVSPESGRDEAGGTLGG